MGSIHSLSVHICLVSRNSSKVVKPCVPISYLDTTLAKGLREKGSICSFISRSLDGNLNHLISLEGFHLKELPPPEKNFTNTNKNKHAHIDWLEVDWKIDACETKDIISNMNPDWLVVDHYSLSEDWEKKVTNQNLSIMVIDDLSVNSKSSSFI